MDKICNKNDCKFFMCLANTDESGQGICSFGESWSPVELNHKCYLIPEEYKCKDCDHFANDYACMTADENDLVDKKDSYGACPGFIDKKEVEMSSILQEWKFRGIDIEKKITTLTKQINDVYNKYIDNCEVN